MKRWEEQGWQQEDLNKLELGFLQDMFSCADGAGVDVTIAYARFLNKTGINSDNYPIYLKLLEMKNHWVVDALVGEEPLEKYFRNIQPNYYIVKDIFRAFAEAKKNGIYEKSLLVYLGLLTASYKDPLEGYRVYPLTTTDVNNLGKHLDETKDQMYSLNRSILMILDRIASLSDPGNISKDEDILKVATQANNIRGKFLDMTKHLKEAIPDLLLEPGDFAGNEVSPDLMK
ncbi:MAG: hypothetical protein JW874_14850 [Spirochaetales bacterium]|nr:hypothetical protein [Spirochaetales bacterium]